jgi:hypothetical protein
VDSLVVSFEIKIKIKKLFHHEGSSINCYQFQEVIIQQRLQQNQEKFETLKNGSDWMKKKF